MKKYKTSEAIAMLEQNPKLSFKATSMNGYPKTLYLRNGINCSQFDEDAGLKGEGVTHNIKIYLDDEWTLVEQPVPFMEAVKAYAEGKTIRCERPSGKWTYKPYTADILQMIQTYDGHILSCADVMQGTWYIEDGEN